jgi:hypothetical protein
MRVQLFTISLLALLTGCGGSNLSSGDSQFDSEAKKVCELIEETWQTYLVGDATSSETQDILKAGWYLSSEEMKLVSEKNKKFLEYVKGLEDAYAENYESPEFKLVLEFCGLS